MLATTQADGLQLAFCPDQAPIVQSQHSGHSDHNGHLDPPCPFAVAAVAAVIDVPHLDTAAVQAVEQAPAERAIAVPLAGPQRADRIRGPPALS